MLFPTISPILRQFRSKSSEIRRRKERKKEEEETRILEKNKFPHTQKLSLLTDMSPGLTKISKFIL